MGYFLPTGLFSGKRVTAETVRDAFFDLWVKHYGPPELVVADQGAEFTGAALVTAMNEHGFLVHYTDSRSQWQNGKTERAGAILKEKVSVTINDLSIQRIKCGIICSSMGKKQTL